jgi:hypothetical protein
MNLRDLEYKGERIRDAVYEILDDNKFMLCALKDIYNLCLNADENNREKVINEIKAIAWRLS